MHFKESERSKGFIPQYEVLRTPRTPLALVVLVRIQDMDNLALCLPNISSVFLV